MMWQPNSYTPILFIGAGLSLILGLIAWPRRAISPTALPFSVLMWLTAWQAFCYGQQLGGQDLGFVIFWGKMEYNAIAFMQVTWLSFALRYTGRSRWLTFHSRALLFTVPAMVVFCTWTNDWHGLVKSDFVLDLSGPFSVVTFSPGPVYWINIVYNYALFLAGFILIFRAYLHAPRLYRTQARVLLLASIIPLIGNILYLTDLTPWPNLDLTPIAFTLTGVLVAWGLYRYRLLDVVPAARERVIENMAEAVLVLDQRNRVVDANPAAARLLRRPQSEIIGQSAAQVFIAQADLVERFADVETAQEEIGLGEEPNQQWFDLRIAPLHYHRGSRLAGRIVTLYDITARRRTEEQLRKLSQAVEQSPSSIVITDTSGNIEYVNPKFTETTGYTLAEAIGQNPRILKSGRTPPEVYTELWNVITAGREWRGEFLNRKKNGELFWELAVIAPVRGLDGKITHYVAVKEDITARKRTEQALQLAYERLAILREVDADLTSSLQVSYVTMTALDAAMRLSAADAGFIAIADGNELHVVEAIGAYPPGFVDSSIPLDSGILSRVAQQQAELISDVTSNPDYIPFLPGAVAQIAMPLVSQQRLVGVLNLETYTPERFTQEIFEFLKLLTARAGVAIANAQMFEERTQLVGELEAFAHTVAHDLKNPLNNVIGYATVLVQGNMEKSPERAKNHLQVILNNSQKMNNIINELLLLASVRKQDQVPCGPLDMAAIVAEAQERLRLMIEQSGAHITTPSAWPLATGYAAWVEEVWVNYLSNAIKYGGVPPQVDLGAALEDGMVRFWVRDNGAGLTLAEQARLFSQFTRLAEARAEGHGLGLSIVRRIVEKLGGTVGVQSAVGAGSTFSFTLPAAE
jgi:PAS domain S-box-containing protein